MTLRYPPPSKAQILYLDIFLLDMLRYLLYKTVLVNEIQYHSRANVHNPPLPDLASLNDRMDQLR
ncbi:hypothetical protein D3C85_1576060 [compost metagenome]